jgi:hypothetical protein
MDEFDLIGALANPIFAFGAAFLAVASFTSIFYQFIQNSNNRLKTLKLLNLTAEFCAVMGLIGLLTFAGRSKLDVNEHTKNIIAAQAFSTLSKNITTFHENNCEPFNYQNMSPTLKNSSYRKICTFISVYEKNKNPNIYWENFRFDISELSKNSTLTTEQKKTFDELNNSVTKYLKARHAANIEPIESLNNKNRAPWIFLLCCFTIALLGVSIKCAKSLLDFKDQSSFASK